MLSDSLIMFCALEKLELDKSWQWIELIYFILVFNITGNVGKKTALFALQDIKSSTLQTTATEIELISKKIIRVLEIEHKCLLLSVIKG